MKVIQDRTTFRIYTKPHHLPLCPSQSNKLLHWVHLLGNLHGLKVILKYLLKNCVNYCEHAKRKVLQPWMKSTMMLQVCTRFWN